MSQDGWKRCGKGRPCLICGRENGWCRTSGDGASTCMVYHRDAIPCPSGWKPVGDMGKHGGQVFRPETGAGSIEEFKGKSSFEHERIRQDRERKTQAERARAIGQARAAWKTTLSDPDSVNHPAARAYFEARGIDLGPLPGGKLPQSIRYLKSCERWSRDDQGKTFKDSPAPVLICGACDLSRAIVAIQRIYLDRDGAPKKLVCRQGDDAKKASGSSSGPGGAAVRLAPLSKSGMLILTEGVETGVAVQAAVGDAAAVWSCVSTSWMLNVQLPPDWLTPPASEGDAPRLKRVIIAGDHDRHKNPDGSRPGQHAAEIVSKRLRRQHAGLAVGMVLPNGSIVPELCDEQGEPKEGKSVDWLDVARVLGLDAVRDRVLACDCPASPAPVDGHGGGDGSQDDSDDDGDDEKRRPLIADTRVGRAKDLLMARYAPAEGGRAGECFSLAYLGGRYHEWIEGVYIPLEDKEIEAEATHALDQFDDLKRFKVVPFDPSPAEVNATLTASIPFVKVESPVIPAWMPPMFDAAGAPLWHTGAARRWSHKCGGAAPARADSCIVVRNGVLDVDALMNNEVRLLKPSPKLFNLSCIPHDIDTQWLKDAIAADPEFGVGSRALESAPAWCGFLESSSGGDGAWIDLLQEFFGYLYTSDCSQQKFLMIDGLPGAGKGVIADAQMWAVGETNVATTTFGKLGGRFDLAPMMGKLGYQIREMRLGPHVDAAGAQDVLLMLTSHDPLTIERKGVDATPSVRMTGKMLVTLNGNFGLRDPAAALVRRMLVLTMQPFRGTPDRALGAKIKAEANAIFLWGLQGLMRLRKNGGFTETAAGLQLRDSIQARMSPVADFVREFCITGAGQKVACDVLRAAFRQSMEDRGLTGMAQISDGEFGEQLRSAIGNVDRRCLGARGRRRYFYDGLRLVEERDYIADDAGNSTLKTAPEPLHQDSLPTKWAERKGVAVAQQDEIPFH